MLPLLIGAGISAITGLIGAGKQAGAAKDAAAIQADAAKQVAQMGQQAGNQAAGAVTSAGADAAAGVLDASQQAAAGVTQAGQTAATGVTDAANAAATGVEGAADEANILLKSIYDAQMAGLDPYTQAGKGAISDLSSAGAEKFVFSEDDPSYQWRLNEGMKALERSAAARGGLQSGGTLRGITRYAQGAASQEYQAAFDRFLADREARRRILSDLAGFGLDATKTGVTAGMHYGTQAANNITGAANAAGAFRLGGAESAGGFLTDAAMGAGGFTYGGAADAGKFQYGAAADAGKFKLAGVGIAGDALTGAANATAAGKVGAANAWAGGLNSIGGAAQNVAGYYALKDIWQEKEKR